jgi:inosine/xanthosine triphosphate pyrophosphatase family protein
MSTYVTVTMFSSVPQAKKLYREIAPILVEAGAKSNKSAKSQGLVESEHLLSSKLKAKTVTRALNKTLKKATFKAVASVMPPSYVETGSRGIVRPDYASGKKGPSIPGFSSMFRKTKKAKSV